MRRIGREADARSAWIAKGYHDLQNVNCRLGCLLGSFSLRVDDLLADMHMLPLDLLSFSLEDRTIKL
mgnify:CR=1 FL=1|jgi:hypothetical protein